MRKVKYENLSDRVFLVIVRVLSVLILLSMAYPLYYVLLASFSDPAMLGNGQIWLIPKKLSLEGYTRAFNYAALWTGYRNTILYTIASVIISLAVTIPAAYAMSRKTLMLRNPIMVYYVITMFFGGGLIPTYLVIKQLGLLNNPLVLFLPGFGVYNMIIVRTFIQSNIPGELHDAASIDGCGEGRFFISVVVPLSKAVIFVIVLYCAVGQWNSYFSALIYLNDNKYKPLQLALREILIISSYNERNTSSESFAQQFQVRELMKYSVIVLSSLPVMCFYPFIQKYFTQGVLIGSLKG